MLIGALLGGAAMWVYCFCPPGGVCPTGTTGVCSVGGGSAGISGAGVPAIVVAAIVGGFLGHTLEK
jgi:hypothetical protein